LYIYIRLRTIYDHVHLNQEKMRTIYILFFLIPLAPGAQPVVKVLPEPGENRVDIMVDGLLFTSYCYSATLMKPVLWPVISPGGHVVTRSFPLDRVEGERVDHPHQVGVWLNYGDVNGVDFWNNTTDKAAGFGTILHKEITRAESKPGEAVLAVRADWIDSGKKILMEEETTFIFRSGTNFRIIDRITCLTASECDIKFSDNKEGMYAIRVSTELELPESGEVMVLDSAGTVVSTLNHTRRKVSGNYFSSEGASGSRVWGTRARWMQLSGQIMDENVSVIIIDHPQNPGYPTYWHARGYGLFAANPLGQKPLSGGKNELNFLLPKGKSLIFRYRMVIASGSISAGSIEKLAGEWSNPQ
jgi:hypothetical protein